MKAGILLAAIVGLGTALWFGGVLQPASRDILVTEATATPMMDGAVAAVLTIENTGAPDQLLSVDSADGEVAFEAAEAGLPIQTGRSSLALDAAHIVLTQTDIAVEEGTLLPLTLTFADAGDVAVKVRFAPPPPGSMAAHMAMGHGSMKHTVTEEPFPSIALSADQTADGWLARIAVENFTFSKDQQDGDHVDGVGHGHIYVGGMKLGRVFGDTFSVGALPKGEHVLRVTLNTNDHRTYVVEGQPLAAETVIVVD